MNKLIFKIYMVEYRLLSILYNRVFSHTRWKFRFWDYCNRRFPIVENIEQE